LEVVDQFFRVACSKLADVPSNTIAAAHLKEACTYFFQFGIEGDRSPNCQTPADSDGGFFVPDDFRYSIQGYPFPREPVLEISGTLLPIPAHRLESS